VAAKEHNFMSWKAVYALVKKIPRGKVLTYGGIAKAIKLKGGARTAGHAMAATPKGQGVPWHRVVGVGGRLLIREPYASLQKKLLASEGAKITETCVDMKTSAWAPPAHKRATKPAKQKHPAPRKRGGPAGKRS
jgi:methylated-DNA-protein-cysteine methyltransferase-like protein